MTKSRRFSPIDVVTIMFIKYTYNFIKKNYQRFFFQRTRQHKNIFAMNLVGIITCVITDREFQFQPDVVPPSNIALP